MLKISKLISGYSDKFRLKEISLHVNKGSLTGIVGPNGSGKTTLFRSLTSEINILGGEILLEGRDIKKLTSKEKAQKLAIVTQNTEVFDIPVEDFVLMGRLPYKKPFQLFEKVKDYALANKFMKLTGVYKYKAKLMTELSGGEQQLVAIARALCQEPELLLLDEPTSHLDISHQLKVLNLIQKLNNDLGLTVLIIIHDLNLASEYCDYMAMMHKGSIFKKGLPEEVLDYKNIEFVYDTVVITQINPLSKKPAIFLVSDKVLKKNSSEPRH
ncbi:MAG: ABC transporter ATP-binding protein [Salinivirgaceae bacterium]|jgi:iron complex transport system ATP-binding protein|nr:ABC transporter ATP-binding protein [Salinivirgaceae bacterium]